MTDRINVSKPAVSIRSEIADLKKPSGVAGEAVLRANTPQEQFNLIGAGRRNIIINGAVKVDQRGSGTIVVSGGVIGPDRFRISTYNLDNMAGTITQDSDSPNGFNNSLKITITTAESAVAVDEYAYVSTRIEAQDLQQLGYGTVGAEFATLSFWVKSTAIGTYAVGIYKPDNTAQISNITYTINNASTWEYKTVTFSPNILSGGGINDDNGIGFYINWHLAAGSNFTGGGSTSGWTAYSNPKWADGHETDGVITTTNGTFQLTGVQFELGKVATPFEHRSYGEELALCQRYYYRDYAGVAYGNFITAVCQSGTDHRGVYYLPVPMRASPSLSANGSFALLGNSMTYSSMEIGDGASTGSRQPIRINSSGNNTSGYSVILRANNDSDAYIEYDAEL